ncbi:MAG: TlpA family protein disulfide reductase [Holophagales bacterium]|nr:TlpA family protein disulfide reductase [Holophagales bacterium]
MSSSPSPLPSSLRTVTAPVLTWIGAVAVVFLLLDFGMGHVADGFPVDPTGISNPASAGTSPGQQRAYPAPDFRLASLDGPALGPLDYLGKVVVIDLWATWCGPCRLQAEHLELLHAEYGDQVQFLAIDVGEDEETVRRYVERTPFSYPVLLDPHETVQRRFGTNGLPTVIVIDVTGEVSFVNVGVTPPAVLRREIEAAKLAQGEA